MPMYAREAFYDLKQYFTGLPQTPDHATSHTEIAYKYLPGGLQVTGSGKPHRRASNSCKNITREWLTCVKNSPCFQQGNDAEACIQSMDPTEIGQECIALRRGYTQCRRDLLARHRIWMRGNHYT